MSDRATAPSGPAAMSNAPDAGDNAKWWTLAAVCTGVFMLLLDITIVNVALPDIQSDLNVEHISDIQWVIDAYALSLAALLLTSGSLADIFGRKRLFAIGLVVFTTGSVFCGVAPNVTFLSISRAGQGIGGAMMFATALALIASAFTGKDRGTAFAAFGATTGVSVAVGPVLGGLLVTGLSWRWIFFVNIPICAVALFITLGRVKESQDPRAGRPDFIGFITFSVALAGLVYGLIEAGQHSWGQPRVVASFVVAAVLLVVFIVSQMRIRQPMFDLGLLRKPTFTGGLIAAFGISSAVFALFTYLVLYLQGVLGFSAAKAGLIFLCLSGTSFVAAILSGRLTEKVPIKLLIAPGFILCGIGLLLQHGIVESVDKSHWTHLIPGLLIAGFGVGMINPPLASTAVGVVSPAESGMASGVNSTFRQVGIATGTAALGSILAHQVAHTFTSKVPGAPAAAVDAVSSGQVRLAAANAPADQQDNVLTIGGAAYIHALNNIILIAAITCFAAAVLTFVLIRQKDFVARGGPEQAAAAPGDDGSAGPADGVLVGSAAHRGDPALEAPMPGGDHVAGSHVDQDAHAQLLAEAADEGQGSSV